MIAGVTSFSLVLRLRMSLIPLHEVALPDTAISLLCHNYAIKGCQIGSDVTALDISVIIPLLGGPLYVRAISQIIMRSRVSCYAIVDKCENKGLIASVDGKRKRYQLTDKGHAVYSKYLEGYEVMRANLIRLEGLREAKMNKG